MSDFEILRECTESIHVGCGICTAANAALGRIERFAKAQTRVVEALREEAWNVVAWADSADSSGLAAAIRGLQAALDALFALDQLEEK